MKNKWFIAIKKRGEDIYDLSNLTILESPEGHYWADPFLIEQGAATYLFFEDYDYAKGKIAMAEVIESPSGEISLFNPQVVINEPWHMSFPSVYTVGDMFFMCPERVISGTLWIYKAARFPDVWGQYSLVSRGRFDDPIIRKVENGWQVWATEDNKLVVFEAATLHSENWRVVRREDKPNMRNAGNFIGDIRPTQDCVPTYGRAIHFMEGVDNTRRSIEPTWYPNLTGTHTFNVSSKYVVVDGRIKLHDPKMDTA